MTSLLLNNRTKKDAAGFIKKSSHALLISAPTGSGKFSLSQQIAASLIGASSEQLDSHPYLIYVKKPEDKQEIPIDEIRKLIKKLSLKAPGKGTIRKVIIIEDAQHMSEEAQNAMLKILEEPSADSVFLITVNSSEQLLPTIVSRAQQINVLPVNSTDAAAYYAGQYGETEVASAWQLSQGRVGLMSALLNHDSSHPLREAIIEAKAFLKKTKYERLLEIDSLSKDKTRLANFLEALSRLLSALQSSAVSKGTTAQAKKILASRQLVSQISQSIEANASPRLALLKLAQNLLH